MAAFEPGQPRPRSPGRLPPSARGAGRRHPARADHDPGRRHARGAQAQRHQVHRAEGGAGPRRLPAHRPRPDRRGGRGGGGSRPRGRDRQRLRRGLPDRAHRGGGGGPPAGGGEPVDRDHPPPHRRDRRAGAHHPAPGRGPHPGPAARRGRPRAHQAPAGPDGEAHLPPARRERDRAGPALRPRAAGLAAPAQRRGGRGRRRDILRHPQAGHGERRFAGRCGDHARPDRAVGGELPLRFHRCAEVRRRDHRECRQALRHRAGRPGHQRAGDPRAHRRRQRADHRQLHRRGGQRPLAPAARRARCPRR